MEALVLGVFLALGENELWKLRRAREIGFPTAQVSGVIDSGSSGLRTTTLLRAAAGESVGATLGGPYAKRGRRESRPGGMHPQRPPPHGRAAVWCSRRGRRWRLLYCRPTGNVSKASSPTSGRNPWPSARAPGRLRPTRARGLFGSGRRNPRRPTPKKPA